MKHFEITIIWLRDSQGLFPHALFGGDTDASTDGWVSFTARSRQEVVVASLTPTEWNSGESGIQSALARVNANLGRNDLVPIRLLSVGERASAKGVSFAQFRPAKPSPPLYSALCEGESAAQVRSESLEEFEGNGGKFTLSAA